MPVCLSAHSIPVDKDERDIVVEAAGRAFMFMVSLDRIIHYKTLLRELLSVQLKVRMTHWIR